MFDKIKHVKFLGHDLVYWSAKGPTLKVWDTPEAYHFRGFGVEGFVVKRRA